MALVTIQVRTAEKDDTRYGGSSDKFYRTFRLPTCALFQWGSQRNGRSGGQFKIAPDPGDAVSQFTKKLNEGYTTVGGIDTFDVDEAKLRQMVAQGHKALGGFLESIYAASARSGSNRPAPAPSSPAAPQPSPTPPPAERVFDRISQTNERALTAISQAATEPAKALTEYALLQGELDALEADLRKVHSYMATLGVLVEEAL